MSESLTSPFFTQPGLGSSVSELARTLIPDPTALAIRNQRDAAARLDQAKVDQLRTQQQGWSGLAQAIRNGGTDPTALRGIIANAAGTGDAQALGQVPGLLRAYGFSQSISPEQGAQLFQGAGGAYENTQPGFERTDTTRRRGQDVSAGATLGAARIGADASITREQMQQSGLDRRMAPEINPNNVVVVPASSPLANRADENGRIAGNMRPQTYEGAKANLVQPYVEGTLPPDQMGRTRELLAGGANRAPMDINGTDAQAIDQQIMFAMPATLGVADGTSLSPQAALIVRARAAELYQQNRNLPLAAQQALRELAAQNPPRTTSSLWGLIGKNEVGAPTTPVQTPMHLPSTSYRSDSVPPPAQRRAGQVYQTPRGPMAWTGTGWRPAS